MSNNCVNSQKIFFNFLSQHHITLNELYETISAFKIDSLQASVFYISQMDNVGNTSSDIDIYIIHQGEKISPRTHKIKDLILDIEFWTISDLNECFQKNIIEHKFDKIFLKLLHRLKTGFVETTDNSCFNQFVSQYTDQQLCDITKDNNILLANSTLDDVLKMMKNHNYSCALICSNKVLEYTLTAYCAHNGIANINDKWLPFILEKTNAFSDMTIINAYFKYYIFKNINKANIVNVIKEIINISQDILFKIAF